jgi:hypothetical protein
MFKRKRRFKGTWLPVVGQFENDTGGPTFPRRDSLTANGVVPPVSIFPITYDVPQDNDQINPGQAGAGMGEIIGNEYALRRIVGKCFCLRQELRVGTQTTDNGRAIVVAAGFFIARAQDQFDGDVDLPVGAGAGGAVNDTQRRDLFGPLEMGTMREPWIWRRTWVLGAGWNPTDAAEAFGSSFLFGSNVHGGSVMDGPHVDARTRRRVKQQERLYFAWSFAPFQDGIQGTPGIEGQIVDLVLDVRLFGALRKARNQGAF